MRAAVALSLLLALPALGGCIGDNGDSVESTNTPSTPSVDDVPSVVHGPAGADAVLEEGKARVSGLAMPIGDKAIEPTLGITSDGTIVYAAAQFTDDPVENPVTDILRSDDGGKTWTDITPRLPDGETHSPPQTGDPYVWVDEETDRVYSIDMFPALSCSWLSFSDDKGESWTTRPLSCEGTPPVYDHQTLGGGNPSMTPTTAYDNILYQCINRVSDSLCSRSLDGGLSWSAGTPVFKGYDPSKAEVDTSDLGSAIGGAFEGLCGGLHGHVNVGTEGTVYLPRNYCGDAAVGISTDDGLTWTTKTIGDDGFQLNGPDPAVATDDAGNAYYLYTNRSGVLKYAFTTDQGQTWSDPIDVGHPNVTATHLPTIDAIGDGKVAFAYTGTENLPKGYDNEEFDDGHDDDDDDINGATWNGYIAVVEDALSEEPTIQTTLVNDRSEPLVRGYCGPGRCPGMYDFIDIQIAPDGRPYAAFVDACTDKCDTPEGTYEDSQGDEMSFKGLVGTLNSGPSLTDEAPLEPLDGVNATSGS